MVREGQEWMQAPSRHMPTDRRRGMDPESRNTIFPSPVQEKANPKVRSTVIYNKGPIVFAKRVVPPQG